MNCEWIEYIPGKSGYHPEENEPILIYSVKGYSLLEVAVWKCGKGIVTLKEGYSLNNITH